MDGSTIRGDASKHKAMSYGLMDEAEATPDVKAQRNFTDPEPPGGKREMNVSRRQPMHPFPGQIEG